MLDGAEEAAAAECTSATAKPSAPAKALTKAHVATDTKAKARARATQMDSVVSMGAPKAPTTQKAQRKGSKAAHDITSLTMLQTPPIQPTAPRQMGREASLALKTDSLRLASMQVAPFRTMIAANALLHIITNLPTAIAVVRLAASLF